MIFVDANYFLRVLAPPTTSRDIVMAHQAADLFRKAQRDAVKITTSDAVLAEVAFLLTSPRVYGLNVSHVCERMRVLVDLRGMRSRSKAIWLEAFEFWTDHPNLGFVDSLSYVYTRAESHELATFDGPLSAMPDLKLYLPTNPPPSTDPPS